MRAVEAFVEKPDAATAATYVADRYLWNSGNFLFHAATMLSEIGRCEPVMAEARKSTRSVDLTRDSIDFFHDVLAVRSLLASRQRLVTVIAATQSRKSPPLR